MNYLLTLILSLLIFLISDSALAVPETDFELNLKNWNKNIALASKYLEDAEKDLKDGDPVQSCIKQRKAANYGIEATESLIKVFEENGSKEDINNIKSGLNKWKELRDFC